MMVRLQRKSSQKSSHSDASTTQSSPVASASNLPPGFIAPTKPPYLWRVTDSTSLTRIDPSTGSFDTGVCLWGHWSYWTSIINPRNLNAQIDWSHKFTPSGHGDPPLFISATDDSQWAYEEFDRRMQRRRRHVRINVIDTAALEWELAFLENGSRLPVLRDKETGCTFFSSEGASGALGWVNPYRSRSEWFAIKCIPAKVILPEAWGDD
ncbi:Hypothetical predicted protein [Lecanosticta acicola]|uniref:DUF7587 domain-containing protein n=1 Tax=Lecanosticta acicola TaxID=111012 RepID=A0AAI8Z7C6_9PEZI|nr:Hypothetical predicted protein [Lecanosticta acicola]